MHLKLYGDCSSGKHSFARHIDSLERRMAYKVEVKFLLSLRLSWYAWAPAACTSLQQCHAMSQALTLLSILSAPVVHAVVHHHAEIDHLLVHNYRQEYSMASALIPRQPSCMIVQDREITTYGCIRRDCKNNRSARVSGGYRGTRRSASTA
jgi:hypothetical protein